MASFALNIQCENCEIINIATEAEAEYYNINFHKSIFGK